jgi:multiple sugar transport system substrate-binding protein
MTQSSGLPTTSRRSLLRGAALGAAAFAVPASLVACGKSGSNSGSGKTVDKNVTFGSNYSDDVPKKALADVLATYQTSNSATVKINTVDHNTFQENITRYLQGSPDDVFTWFAGYRMQFFAAQGLATPIDDVWTSVGGNFSDALKKASTGADGHQYFVPFYYYPWAVFYRKSVFAAKGYTPPKTWDDYVALAGKLKADGMPIAFCDKDGWPAMGTFDYINMRTNGYDFHVSLMAGKESWTDPKVKQVFDTWRQIFPYYNTGSNGITWQEAAQSLLQKKTGMFTLGMFVGQQFSGADKDDLDFFPFPQINAQYGQDSVEAPIDGFMISKKAKNAAGGKELLKYLAGAEAQNAYLKSDNNNVATNSKADTSGYNALQKKAVELVGQAKSISQFLDRDTRPDFASTVMIPALQQFVDDTSKGANNVDSLLKNIESQKKTIFAS